MQEKDEEFQFKIAELQKSVMALEDLTRPKDSAKKSDKSKTAPIGGALTGEAYEQLVDKVEADLETQKNELEEMFKKELRAINNQIKRDKQELEVNLKNMSRGGAGIGGPGPAGRGRGGPVGRAGAMGG